MKYTVYSKPACQFCDKAKALLEQRGADFDVIMLDVGQPKVDGVTYITRDELLAKIPNARTMPQILQDGVAIGGYQELVKVLG